MDARETKVYIALLIVVITVGGTLGLFLVSMVRLHRRYLKLQKSVSVGHLLNLEQERKRISADLHDELGPIFSAAKFKIAGVESVNKEDQLLLDQASVHIDNIIDRVRAISNGLMPNTLLRKGPVYAIEEFIRSATAYSALKITFNPVQIPELSQDQAINIYRILQEVIHNTIKHADARKLVITFSLLKDLLQIYCVDDGKGFNVNQVTRESKGMGLQNILLRMDMLGGSVSIDTKPGNGTKVFLDIPFHLLTLTNDKVSANH